MRVLIIISIFLVTAVFSHKIFREYIVQEADDNKTIKKVSEGIENKYEETGTATEDAVSESKTELDDTFDKLGEISNFFKNSIDDKHDHKAAESDNDEISEGKIILKRDSMIHAEEIEDRYNNLLERYFEILTFKIEEGSHERKKDTDNI